jgi:hypothetical protein
MIRDDAQKLVDRFQEHFDAGDCGITASVAPQTHQIDFAAPGGGRPRIFRYKVRLTDGRRISLLDLDEAEVLLGTLREGAGQVWGADRLFDAAAAQGLAVAPVEVAELPD